MKKSIFVLLLASSSLMQAMEMTNLKEGLKNKSENKLEKFKRFEELPQDIQNEIIKFAWKNVDNKETFEKQLFNLKSDISSYKETTHNERKMYGFHGEKEPIHFYTLENQKPIVKIVGNILNDARKSYYNGWWFPYENLSTKLFIHGPNNKIYSATLVDSENLQRNPYVFYACFSVLGDLAVCWEKNQEDLISIIKLKDIKQNDTIDLKKNVQPKIKFFYNNCLFTLDGSQFGIRLGKFGLINNTTTLTREDSTSYLDVPHDKPLTLAEKAKRLGIEIEEVKKLVKQKTNKQKSFSHTYLYAATGLGIAAVLGLTWYYYKK